MVIRGLEFGSGVTMFPGLVYDHLLYLLPLRPWIFSKGARGGEKNRHTYTHTLRFIDSFGIGANTVFRFILCFVQSVSNGP